MVHLCENVDLVLEVNFVVCVHQTPLINFNSEGAVILLFVSFLHQSVATFSDVVIVDEVVIVDVLFVDVEHQQLLSSRDKLIIKY